MQDSPPLLSVIVLTYNHAAYIAQAIESILSQRTSFKYEIIIADDYSTDGTREILISYKNKYPAAIKLILQEANVGATANWKDLIMAPQTKYVACLEGDDYWNDETKIQKQIEFLELNPAFSMCTGNTKMTYSDDPKHIEHFRPDHTDCDLEVVGLEDQIRFGVPYHTSTVMFRNLYKMYPPVVFESISGDIPLFTVLATTGKIFYMDVVLSVYRFHPTNLTRINANNPESKFARKILMFKNLNRFLNFKYEHLYRQHIYDSLSRFILALNRKGSYFKAYQHMPELFGYSKSTRAFLNFVGTNIKATVNGLLGR